LATAQETDEELKKYNQSKSGLRLEKIDVSRTGVTIFCDTSIETSRSFLTKSFRRAAFNSIHLAHLGIKATIKLISQRYVWPSMRVDCRNWAHTCVQCQRAKIIWHVTAPLGIFTKPSRRFDHIHIDIISMPISEGKRYYLMCIDCFTRWPETFLLEDQEAETVARAFYEGWICRFGTPLRVMTDQGRQFESHFFRQLSELTRTSHLRTTAYHSRRTAW